MNANDQAVITATLEGQSKRKPGRPAVEGSERQKRIAELAEKKKDPLFRLGRPVDPNSPRQQKLATKGKDAAQRGRPKMSDEAKAEAKKIRDAKYAEALAALKPKTITAEINADEVAAEMESVEF
jgi:hypothetical protein